jgi:hypothetical protein
MRDDITPTIATGSRILTVYLLVTFCLAISCGGNWPCSPCSEPPPQSFSDKKFILSEESQEHMDIDSDREFPHAHMGMFGIVMEIDVTHGYVYFTYARDGTDVVETWRITESLPMRP